MQWEKEIEAFIPATYNEPDAVVVIKNTAALCTHSVESFKKANIVLVSSDLMTTNRYFEELAKLTALNLSMLSDTNRVSRLWLNLSLEGLRVSVNQLQRSVSDSSFLKWLGQRRVDNDHRFKEFNVDDSVQTGPEKEPAAAQQSDGESEPDSEIRGTEKAGNRSSPICPILHMFRWNRLVIDEFALVTSKPSLLFSCFVRRDADKRWILSGTPPLDDFHDTKLIAKLIGIDLGPDSFYPGIISNETVRHFRGQLSPAERFQSFQEKRSFHWHIRRHQHTGKFLDTFVRQNCRLGRNSCPGFSSSSIARSIAPSCLSGT